MQVSWQHSNYCDLSDSAFENADMLGFKLEHRREGNVGEKVRPIYLDMQVGTIMSDL